MPPPSFTLSRGAAAASHRPLTTRLSAPPGQPPQGATWDRPARAPVCDRLAAQSGVLVNLDLQGASLQVAAIEVLDGGLGRGLILKLHSAVALQPSRPNSKLRWIR